MARMKKTKITVLCPVCMKHFVEFEVGMYRWTKNSATIINSHFRGQTQEKRCSCGAKIINRDSNINLDIKNQ